MSKIKEILIGTNNNGKYREICNLLPNELKKYSPKEFDILTPKKNKKGNRLFTPKDIKNLQIIYHLIKERGFTLEGAKMKLKENKEDTIDNIEIVNRLKEIRDFLVKLKEEL